MDGDSLGKGAVFVLFVAMGAIIVWSHARGRSMLETWAYRKGYELLSREECWFFRGPFFWGTSEGQKVYKVTVREAEGAVRHGYVRCGSFWRGLWSDDVEARWSD